MKSDAARNGGASNTGTGYLPFTEKNLSWNMREVRFINPIFVSIRSARILQLYRKPKIAYNIVSKTILDKTKEETTKLRKEVST